MLTQLIHNGIIIPEPPTYRGLTIIVRGVEVKLTPEQEEMALAWAHKKDTPYVRDPVFAANFLRDFSVALGVQPPLSLEEVDFTACIRVVEEEQATKIGMSAEERKALAAERKAQREALKARYGYAIVNGQRVELGNYMAEPSGIFMGRGQHPLRGRWKAGAQQSDITLNLSPDAPPVEGNWGKIDWKPESLWVAKWQDKLADKLKYIWLSDTAPAKQSREARKFDKATALDTDLDRVRARIEQDLVDPNPRRRMIATACYLIDALCLRVGDEKDPDEADTVGATTLRPEHITLHEGGLVEFKFLGKDSVAWHKKLTLPSVVVDNLAELSRSARPSRSALNGDRSHPTRDLPQLFPDVASHDVNAYLSSILPGLTAKVFRTHHATRVVRESLQGSRVCATSPEHAKWQATIMANLEAAMLCNHTKQASGNWPATRERYRERRQKAEERLARCREEVKELKAALDTLKKEAREKEAAVEDAGRRKQVRERYRTRMDKAKARLEAAEEKRSRAQMAVDKLAAQATIAGKKRTWNLGTSLKSYIDPRVYYRWGQEVDYDVLGRYYPTILQRKFAWVRLMDDAQGGTAQSEETLITLRTCTTADLAAVEQLFQAIRDEYPDAGLPLTAEEIGREYLPSLDRQDWREAIIALGEEQEALGFAVLGPEWHEDDQTRLDLLATLHPDQKNTALADLLAEEVRRRLQSYQAHHPKEICVLYPRDTRWSAWAPGIYEALELGAEQEENSLTEDPGAEADRDG